MGLLKYIKVLIMRRKWRRVNEHNHTNLVNIVDFSKIRVGMGTYGDIKALFHNDNRKLFIGNYCSIASGVTFIPESDHCINSLSTYPWKAMMFGMPEAVSKGDIVVDDDVWIGCNAIILSGVHIGQGAVVAAGAVVTHDVPPYAVVAGVPAQVIKYRFTQEIRTKLENIDYSKLSDEEVRAHIKELYEIVTEKTDLSWLPKQKKR